MFLLFRRYKSLDLFLLQVLQIVVRTIHRRRQVTRRSSRGDRRSRGTSPRRLPTELFRYQSWLTAREVLALHCELAGIDRTAWQREIADALAIIGLADRGSGRIATFSKGMQQRLGLGVALLGAPDLVVLDEPTSALDPVGRHDVREIIRGLGERGTTVFLNSHLLSEVEQVCHRVAIVDRGRVVAEGTLDELLGGDTVRIRASGLDRAAQTALSRFGQLDDEGEWLVIRGIDTERVPSSSPRSCGSGAASTRSNHDMSHWRTVSSDSSDSHN